MTKHSQIRAVCLHRQDDLRLDTRAMNAPREVRVAAVPAGSCESDLHCWLEGGIGTIRMGEPIILGHEAGRNDATSEGVTGLSVGQLVAINPSHPSGLCDFCQQGLPIHCSAMTFKGSAMYLPHQQGMFRDTVVIGPSQCAVLPDGTDPSAAVCAGPLAVCLDAANRGTALSGPMLGKTVLVSVAIARQRGAAEIIVTDVQRATLAVARQMGAEHAINTATSPDGLAV